MTSFIEVNVRRYIVPADEYVLASKRNFENIDMNNESIKIKA